MDEVGYDAEWDCLNSKDFEVPQNRERVFIIGHLRGERTRKVFPFGENDKAINGKRIEKVGNIRSMGKSQSGDIFDVKGIAPTMCSTTTQKDPIKILIDNIGIPTEGTIAKTVRSSGRSSFDKKHSHDLVCILNEKIAIPVLTPDRTEKRQNGRRFKENGDPMFTLTGQDRHGVMINNQRRIKGWVEREDKIFAYGHDKKRSTIQENVFVKGNGIADALTTNHPTKYVDSNYLIRRLTPIECWRLQGFPDWAFDRAVQVNSNSQLYKQAGNSVTVNVIYEVAIRL